MWSVLASLMIVPAAGGQTVGADPNQTVQAAAVDGTSNGITGVVLAKDGSPVAGANVAIAPAGGAGGFFLGNQGQVTPALRDPNTGSMRVVMPMFGRAPRTARTVSSADGAFVFRRIRPGAYTVVVGHAREGWKLIDGVSFSVSDNEPLRIVLEPGFCIEGKVECPLSESGLYVAVRPIDNDTAPLGDWPFQGVMVKPSDRYRYGPLPVGNGYLVMLVSRASEADDVTLKSVFVQPKAGATKQVDLLFPKRRCIRGRVTDDENRPLANVAAYFSTDDEHGSCAGARTDSDGRYCIWDPPAGKGTLELERRQPRGSVCGTVLYDVSFSRKLAVADQDGTVTCDVDGVKRIGLWPGDPAPNFALELLEGGSFELSKHRGKTVVLHVWATWCAPCLRDLPALRKIHKQYANDPKVVFVDISVDETRAAARRYIRGHDMPWDHAYAEKGLDSELLRSMAVGSIPVTFVIGPRGKVLFRGSESADVAQALKAN